MKKSAQPPRPGKNLQIKLTTEKFVKKKGFNSRAREITAGE